MKSTRQTRTIVFHELPSAARGTTKTPPAMVVLALKRCRTHIHFALAGAALSAHLPNLQPADAATIRHDRSDGLYVNNADKGRFDAVGRVVGPGFLASGILISPNLVLTAAHVTSEVQQALTFEVGGRSYSSRRIATHPTWNRDPASGVDLGLFELNRAVTGLPPAKLNTNVEPVGREATIVGFGRTGTGLTGDVKYDGQKRAPRNTLDGYGFGRQDVLMIDFDHPTTANYSTFGSSTPLEREGLTIFGDSGGAAMIENRGQWFVAGVTSFVMQGSASNLGLWADYGDLAGFTSVRSHLAWINGYLSGTGAWASPSFAGAAPRSTLARPAVMSVPEPSSLASLMVALMSLIAARASSGRW